MPMPPWMRPFFGLAGVVPIPGGARVADWLMERFMERTGLVPTLSDRVVVEVTGQPGVTKQQLYFLALAAANGTVRRMGDLFSASPSFGQLAIEYDAADHWVRCTLHYRWSMSATIATGAGAGRIIGDNMDRMAVYRGPSCDVVGGPLDFGTNTTDVPGIPNPTAKAPDLPFRGQPVLTPCPKTKTPNPKPINVNPAPTATTTDPGGEIDSPNPKPPGDNRSRGAVIRSPTDPTSAGGTPVPGPTPTAAGAKCCDKLRLLIPLVYAALSGPATNSETTYPTPTPGATGF